MCGCVYVCTCILILVSLSFRYWALAVPAYAMVTLVLALVFYIGLNFMSTPPPTSLTKMFGKLTFTLSRLRIEPVHSTCF